MLKKSQRAPLLQFSVLWDFFKWPIFVLKLGFLRLSALCDLPETFIKKNFRKRNRVFPGFQHYATYRRPSSKNFFEKNSSILCFFERFSVKKDGFFAASSWGRMVFEIYAYPFGYFLRCKIDKISTIMSFYPWFSVWYCSFGFLQKFATFLSVCEARLRLCVNFEKYNICKSCGHLLVPRSQLPRFPVFRKVHF